MDTNCQAHMAWGNWVARGCDIVHCAYVAVLKSCIKGTLQIKRAPWLTVFKTAAQSASKGQKFIFLLLMMQRL